MTGDGEITFNGTDSYAGVIRFQATQMKRQVIHPSGQHTVC